MGYRVLKEHPDHFIVHDGQAAFPVAKRGLGPETIAKIQSFADGGEVQPVAPVPESAAPTREDVLNQVAQGGPDATIGDAVSSSALLRDFGARLGSNPLVGAVRSVIGGSEPAPTPPGEWRKTPTGWTTQPETPAAEPAAQPEPKTKPEEKPAPAQQGTQATKPTTATGGSSAPRPDTLKTAEQGEIEGIQERAKAAGQEAAVTADILKQRETAMADIGKSFQSRMDGHRERTDALFRDVMQSKIDPQRFWNSRTDSQRTTAAIAMILGGLGSGMTHGPNVALEIIQKNIDRDIDAQKMDLGKKQTLLSHYMEQGRDIMQAHNLAKADLIDATAAQLQRAAAQFGDPKAQAEAKIAIAGAQKQSFQLRQEAEMKHAQIQMERVELSLKAQAMQYQRYQMALAQAAASGQRIDNVEMMPAEMRSRAATLPDGRKVLAKTEKGAEAIDAASQAARELKEVTAEMRTFREHEGRTPMSSTTAGRKADALHLRALKAFAGTAGVANYANLPTQELEQFKGVVPNPGKVVVSDEGFLASLDQMEREANQRLSATLGTHASGYVPQQVGRKAGGE